MLIKLGQELRANFKRTTAAVLKITGRGTLLQDNPVLKRSIGVRNPYVDPINLIQIEILKRLRRRYASKANAKTRIKIHNLDFFFCLFFIILYKRNIIL